MELDQQFSDAIRHTRKILLPSLEKTCRAAFSDILQLSPGQASWLRGRDFPCDESPEHMANHVLQISAEVLANAGLQSGQKLHGYLEWFTRMVRDHSLAKGGLLQIEDFPKIVDDIVLFDHVKRKARTTINKNIQSYKTPHRLEQALDPLRDSFSVRPAMAILDNLYLNGIDAAVVFECPTVRVVHLKTQEAAIAYGSRRWCTAYTIHQNYFPAYKDDLLLLHTPDGERKQLHFRTKQFRNEQDKDDSLDTYINAHEGLGEALAPYCERSMNVMPYTRGLEPLDITKEIPVCRDLPYYVGSGLRRGIEFLDQVCNVPAFRARLDEPEAWAKAADQLATSSAIHVTRSFLRIAKKTTSWDLFTEKTDVGKWLNTAIVAHYFYLIEDYMKLARDSRVWKEQLSREENVPTFLKNIRQIDSDTSKHHLVHGSMGIKGWEEHIPLDFVADKICEYATDGDVHAMQDYLDIVAQKPEWQQKLIADGTMDRIRRIVEREAPENILSYDARIDLIPAFKLLPKRPFPQDLRSGGFSAQPPPDAAP